MYWTPQIQAYAVGFLVDSGVPLYGAAGLVSRWMNVEASGGPTSVNPNSGAFGIAQWLGARKPPIAGDTSLEDQLAYVVQELNSGERGAPYVFAANDIQSGAVGASAYERAEGSAQLFPRDNYTSRTAAGIPAVLNNYLAASEQGGYVGDQQQGGYEQANSPGGSYDVETGPDFYSQQSNSSALPYFLIAAGAALLLLAFNR